MLICKMTIYYLKCVFRNCINAFPFISIINFYIHLLIPHSFSSDPLSSPMSSAGSGSGGNTGSTSKFLRNRACLSNVLLLFKFLFFTFTLKPCTHRLLGSKMLLSSALSTCLRCSSGSNAYSSSVKSRPSNSTGPNMNGLGIRA